jgi:actin related protein 2/3 complex, subunit 5
MKYLYKGMAMPGWGDVSGSVLLVWHEKVCGSCFSYRKFAYARDTLIQLTEIAGTGCIVRVMTDRRTV